MLKRSNGATSRIDKGRIEKIETYWKSDSFVNFLRVLDFDVLGSHFAKAAKDPQMLK